ncbi:TadE/TadG family type IV pilus assembly protein [Faunimonas sp. B44]|uniref:TadE/TadG family type IV pilus assembly protein n=1 Tax=Faunimonas sp. B44 TaxID=3461493 RepID=UPI0040443AAC
MRFARAQSGAVAIEFAIVSLALVLVAFGTIEFGRGLQVRNELSYAVDVAAREVLTDKEATAARIESAVRGAFRASDPERLQVAVTTETVNGVAYRAVDASYPFTFLVPGLAGDGIRLSVARRMPLV